MGEEDVEPNFSCIYPGADCGLGAPRRFITRAWIDWFMRQHEGNPDITLWTAFSRGSKRLIEEEFAEADWVNKEPVCAPNQDVTHGQDDVEIYIYHVERTRV